VSTSDTPPAAAVTQQAIDACLVHARDLLRGAKLLRDGDLPNLAFHLALLALEEVGRHDLLAIQFISSTRPVPPAWPIKHAQNHVQKLFWALFGGSLTTERLTPAVFAELRNLAQTLHAVRLESLYVDADETGVSVPRDAVDVAGVNNLIGLAEARIDMAAAHSFSTEQPAAEDLELIEWFLAIVDEPVWRAFIFSPASVAKIAELHNPRAWIAWVREEYDRATATANAALASEIERSQSPPADRTHDKWSMKIRLYTGSHSIRPRVLTGWNEHLPTIQLTAVKTRKHNELLVELLLGDNVPVQALYHVGWAVARRFTVALNIGTRGYWWWRLPEFTERYYETLRDLDSGQELRAQPGLSLKTPWGSNRVLSEDDLKFTSMVMVALVIFEQRGTVEAFGSYASGLTLLSLNEIHFRFERDALLMFSESLRSMMALVADARGIDAVIGSLLSVVFPTMPAEERARHVATAARVLDTAATGPPADLDVTVRDVAIAKLLCDNYFLQSVGPSLGEQWMPTAGDESVAENDAS
jgi:AbiV family abortive infection protein